MKDTKRGLSAFYPPYPILSSVFLTKLLCRVVLPSVQIQIYVYFVYFVVILRTMRELRKEKMLKEFGSNHILLVLF